MCAGLLHTLQDVFHPHLLEQETPVASSPSPGPDTTCMFPIDRGKRKQCSLGKEPRGQGLQRPRMLIGVFERTEECKILRHFQSNCRLLPAARASPAAPAPPRSRVASAPPLPGLPLLLRRLLLLLLTPAVLVLGFICKEKDKINESVHEA